MMIVDAGGGTVDLSTYAFTTAQPVSVEEIAPADCMFTISVVDASLKLLNNSLGILQGSTRVNMRALEFLKGAQDIF